MLPSPICNENFNKMFNNRVINMKVKQGFSEAKYTRTISALIPALHFVEALKINNFTTSIQHHF